MPPPPPSLAAAGYPSRGFALIITIVLVAFLVLLLVALTSLARVETQVAGNALQLAAARQNALLALNIALGQLQRHAGPDQRTTATADLLNTTNPGATKWTGVWGNALPSSDPGTPQPALLNWLVSGNENADFSFSSAAATFGRITTPPPASGPGAITHRPAQTLPTLDASTTALAPLNAGGIDYRLLLGPGTVGSGPDVPAASFVIAPLVAITTPAAQIPGFSLTDSTPIPTGRYAFWIGDEGVKAKFNLPVNEAALAAAPATDLNRTLFAAAPRAGLEQIAGFAAYAAPVAYLATANTAPGRDARGQIRQTLSRPQIPFFATGAITPAQARLSYHDVTTYGAGVIADSLRGGLRLDLTRGLAAGATQPTGPIATTPQILTGLNSGLFTTRDQAGFTLPPTEPDWSLLRSFYNLRYDGTTPVTPRGQTATAHGIHPLVSSLTLNLGYTTYLDTGTTRARFTIAPVINLWNPYNVPLAAADYTVEYRTLFTSLRMAFLAAGTPLLIHNFPLHEDARFFPDANTSSPSSRGFTFRIPGARFAPGEIRQFSLASDTTYTNGVTLADHTGAPALASSDTGLLVPTGAELVSLFTFPNADTGATAFNQLELYASINLLLDLPSGTDPVLQKADESQVRRYNISGTPFTAFNVIAAHHVLKNPADSFNYQPGTPNNGGLRTLADLNVRAGYTRNGTTGSDWNRNPLWHAADDNHPASVLVNQWPGSSPASSGAVNGVWGPSTLPSAEAFVSLFDLPRADLLSLGQLQHAQFLSHAAVAGNAFANSYTSPFVDPGQPDLSYSLNRALWDRYYFSSVPATLTAPDLTDPEFFLPNSRLRFHLFAPAATALPDLVVDGYTRATSRLLIDGAFNINSTSIPAWRAQLAALHALPLGIRDVATSAAADVLLPPTAAPGDAVARLTAFTHPAPRTLEPNGPNHAPWRGLRTLSSLQLDELATRIVEQVRAHGPFLSLAHFINRRLADHDSGPLQRAIDGLGPTAPSTAEARINPQPNPTSPTASLLPTTVVDAPPAGRIPNRAAIDGLPRATLAPGWLSQADLLTFLGPVISARSDTFVIRAYGETLSPLDSAAPPLSRAWCEVVVQRLPDYADTSLPNQDAWLAPDSVSSHNQTFGRRFEVVSFRWLSPEDI